MRLLVSLAALLAVGAGALAALERVQTWREDDLIAGGTCERAATGLVTPAPFMVCVMPSEGGCSMYAPVQRRSYGRTLWRCAGGEEFWHDD
jgi:hypothetical protein